MNLKSVPFNIALFTPSAQDLKSVRPIKVLDIFQSSSRNFHPDGLFSIETFGKVGEEKRNRMFSYIDLRITVFHPIIYKALCDLKSLYGEILAGREYAIFDQESKDFIKAPALQGNTGYAFFVKHFPELEFEKRPSPRREFNIKLLAKYKENCMLDKLIVMPAGLRDYTVDDNGKPSEDEINGLYRKVFSVASVMENVNSKVNVEYLDAARFSIQLAVMDIFNYIKNMLEGKSKLILGKWASRKVFNSTRNVITSYIPDSKELFDPRSASTNQTVVGLYQYLRSILPVAIKNVRDTYLTDIFTGPNTPALLVNKKTLAKEMVTVDPEYFDEWMTYEGLEKVMARYGEENLRHEPLTIGEHYLALIYKGKGVFKVFHDIDQLPEGFDKKDVYPLTYTELLYLSVYKDSSNTPCFVTRYPITGYGSVYPSYAYLKTTVKSEKREALGDNWEPTGSIAYEFPIFKESFHNSISPSPAHISRLGADK